MTWLAVIALAAAVFVALVWALRAPRAGWEAIVAALMIGMAGYAAQGHPGLPAADKARRESVDITAAAAVQDRLKLAGGASLATDGRMMIADAFSRHGEYADAATVLRGAIDAQPGNSDAWLAMGNALAGHAEGGLSPAALYAYRHAALADPAAPGPPFFLGLAMARGGRFDEARALWAGLLARSPQGAPWRADLVQKLARLDEMMARMKQAQAQAQP